MASRLVVLPLFLVLGCLPAMRSRTDGTQAAAAPGSAAPTTPVPGAAATPQASSAAPSPAADAPASGAVSAACAADPVLQKDLAAADAVTAAAGAGGASAELCFEGASDTCSAEYLVSQKTNAVRALHGLAALTFSAKISWVARGWSQQQAQTDTLSHDGWPTAREAAYAQQFHAVMRTNAENVAMEPTTSVSDMASQAVDAWICSSGHRANLLGQSAALGVGLACNTDRCYGTQIFGYE